MTTHSIRVVMPYHLQTLAQVGSEIVVEFDGPATPGSILDAIEFLYPMLRGTIRDHETKKRRLLLRFFACEKDISHEPLDRLLPELVLSRAEPFIIWGAVAGG
jgi:sulfur-carrier protein